MKQTRKVVTASPENSETPLDDVASWITPTRLFFVRNHFDVPRIEADTWRLSIDGLANKPLELSLEQLQAMPQRSVFATMECAGNGRSSLRPKAHGVQWGAGAIGHAEWTGVPLRDLLDAAGVQPRVKSGVTGVVFTGADRGTEGDSPDPIAFARHLPLDKALHPDTLVALRMNGDTLAPNHGFPARLFVPGWYGVASVKWLTNITLTDQDFDGYFQKVKYNIEVATDDEIGCDTSSGSGTRRVELGPMAIKSQIIRPRAGETIGLGKNRVFGVAWAGEEPVARVDVSTDGGDTWHEAELIGQPPAPYAWTLWEYRWELSQAGTHTIQARATAASGDVQPRVHESLRAGYMINFYRSVAVIAERGTASDEPLTAAAMLYDMDVFAKENAQTPLDVDLDYADGAGI